MGINKNYHCSLYSSWVMNLNTRVEVKVDNTVDGLMDEPTDRQMDGKPGPSCSKLTTSLVNDSIKCTLSGTQIC